MSEIILTPEYWDCECEKDYIHHRCETMCAACEARREDQPQSRINEVIAAGLVIPKRRRTPLVRGQATSDASDRCLHGFLICDDPSCWRSTPAGKA